MGKPAEGIGVYNAHNLFYETLCFLVLHLFLKLGIFFQV